MNYLGFLNLIKKALWFAWFVDTSCHAMSLVFSLGSCLWWVLCLYFIAKRIIFIIRSYVIQCIIISCSKICWWCISEGHLQRNLPQLICKTNCKMFPRDVNTSLNHSTRSSYEWRSFCFWVQYITWTCSRAGMPWMTVRDSFRWDDICNNCQSHDSILLVWWYHED